MYGADFCKTASVTFIAAYVDSLQFAPEFGEGLSNHLPMALVAVERLEARLGLRGRVDAFAAAYTPRLEPAVATNAGAGGAAILGDYDSLGAFEVGYAAELQRRGFDATLENALTTLGRGVPAAAGHGLLRVYFAVEARAMAPTEVVDQELSRGLAYWSARHRVLATSAHGTSLLASVLSQLPPLPSDERAAIQRQRLITERQERVALTSQFLDAAAAVDGATVDVLATAATLARIASVRPDFTLLHALTTAQALVDLGRALPTVDLGPLAQGWSDFVIAASLTENLPTAPPAPSVPADALDQLRQLVATTTDDHALKSAFSLLRLHDHTGDSVFLGAALSLGRAFHG